MSKIDKLFDISGRVAVLTGGGGVICGTMSRELAARGAKVAVLDLAQDAAEACAAAIRDAGGEALAVACNVLERDSVVAAAAAVEEQLGPVDILINGAGGNKPQATAMGDLTFFDLPAEAVRWVIDLNLMGTILPSQVFGQRMAERREGVIVNISSMSSTRALTRVIGYSVAKAGIDCLTRWLAVHLAQEYAPEIRVN
ncbi:MAG: SDR family NAD(P)-dependent oxidoreductase, partial [Anaerolineae bacterium]